MGKLFYIIGKSSTGKDTIFQSLLENEELELKSLVLYTTRPMRAGETPGVQYHFTDEAGLLRLESGNISPQIRKRRICSGTIISRWVCWSPFRRCGNITERTGWFPSTLRWRTGSACSGRLTGNGLRSSPAMRSSAGGSLRTVRISQRRGFGLPESKSGFATGI